MIGFRHSRYENKQAHWVKYRDVYEAGPEFRDRYLVKFSNRESDNDFKNRRLISYVPAFAKAAVDEVKNAIFQRISDVTRAGGPVSYQDAVMGVGHGVDLRGSTMGSFVGRKILPELLPIGKVGIMVGRTSRVGTTKNQKSPPPFLREYPAEDILSWSYKEAGHPWELETLLIRDYREVADKETGLRNGSETIYKFFKFVNGLVVCEERNEDDKPLRTIPSNLSIIPFVILELTDSLLRDIADYQIGLLNICSSDMNFILKGNIPFYVEQEDPRKTGNHLKRGGDTENEPEDYLSEEQSTDDVIRIGVVDGRRYGKGLDQPGFIAPPTEPLQASMEKQEQMKNEIRQLINLTLSDVKSISAESKKMDDRGLEAGLSYIGLELEHAERLISKIWAEYEGGQNEATVKYPERYSLKSDDEILEEVEKLEERMAKIPSVAYKKELAKRIAETLLGNKVDLDTLKAIKNEIDEADMLTTDPEVIFRAVENAMLSNEVGAKALGFPKGDTIQAAQDHADRAARIAEAQASIRDRGVSDLQNPNDGKNDKKVVKDRKQVES